MRYPKIILGIALTAILNIILMKIFNRAKTEAGALSDFMQHFVLTLLGFGLYAIVFIITAGLFLKFGYIGKIGG